jgi:hypothetical protein
MVSYQEDGLTWDVDGWVTWQIDRNAPWRLWMRRGEDWGSQLYATLAENGSGARFGALHRLNPARKFRQQTVASRLEHAATMRSHLWIDHTRAHGRQLCECAWLVGSNQTGIGHDISRQNGRQPPTARLRAHACSRAATLRGKT